MEGRERRGLTRALAALSCRMWNMVERRLRSIWTDLILRRSPWRDRAFIVTTHSEAVCTGVDGSDEQRTAGKMMADGD
eukprot:765950-Hanusia_phi.AAC.1